MSSLPAQSSPKSQLHCSRNVRDGVLARGMLARGVLALLVAVLGMLTAPGCARRAYTDVYVENMASEIRDLEDQLYEFDSEYRALEQELDALHAENARLKSTLSSPTTGEGAAGNAGQGLPRNGATQPRLLPVPGSSTAPSTSRSGSSGQGAAPRTQPGPAPSLDVTPGMKPSVPQQPGVTPTPTTPRQAPPPSEPGAGNADPYNIENLTPPTIEQGEAMPPSLPPPQNDPSAPITSSSPSALEIELGQIPLPAQLASATSAEGDDGAPARLTALPEMPSDTRVTEVNFHPSLCRAINLDEQPGDDGLYLVLQPLNEGREFVPLPADLLIVAIDPARDGAQGRIGRWSLTSAEAEAKLQPIGSSQGIHLSLPWTGGDPQADRVIVFVRYTMSDGRQIVGEHTILVNDARRPNTVWVPRAKANMPGSNVRTASGERAVR